MESDRFDDIWRGIRILCVPEKNTEEFLTDTRNSKLAAEFNITVKRYPQEALKTVSNDDFDCIISGYDLAESNGVDFLTEVRDLFSEMPFIMVTDAGNESVAERAIREGVTSYFSKQSVRDCGSELVEEIKKGVGYEKETVIDAERSLSEIIEIIPGSVFMKNIEGEYYLMDETNKELFGIDSGDDYIGIHEKEIFPSSEVENFQNEREEVIKKGGVTINKEEITTDSEIVEEITRRVPIYSTDGDIIGVFGVATVENRFNRLFNELNDPIVEFELINGEPVIVQTNKEFLTVFAPDRDSVAGEPLNDLIVPPENQHEADELDRRTIKGKSNCAIIDRKTANGIKQFAYRSVSTSNNHGFAIYTDITKKVQQEKHLDVLQRILRHNLRNDINVIHGHIEQLLQQIEDRSERESANTIKRKARDLTRLCEEAKKIREVLDGPQELDVIELHTVVMEAVREHREQYPDTTIEFECQDTVEVYAGNKLQTVIDSLIDNAIKHNQSASPLVSVSVTVQDDSIAEVEVTDNGPGIPKAEKDVIVGEKSVSPLSHGSGLGLWLVKWITDSYGSALQITTPDSGGTTVRFTLEVAQ